VLSWKVPCLCTAAPAAEFLNERTLAVIDPTELLGISGCIALREFQQEFRPESYGDLSSCRIPVLQISAIS
jgi:hypothetical protein